MKTRSLLLLAALAGGSLRSAQPAAAPAAAEPQSPADRDFAAFNADLATKPPATPKEMGVEKYYAWSDAKLLQARTTALELCGKHPADPRRWEAVLHQETGDSVRDRDQAIHSPIFEAAQGSQREVHSPVGHRAGAAEPSGHEGDPGGVGGVGMDDGVGAAARRPSEPPGAHRIELEPERQGQGLEPLSPGLTVEVAIGHVELGELGPGRATVLGRKRGDL